MADIVWSKEQEEALDTNNGNYTISASAGSGKSTVLTERVFRLINEGKAKVQNLLVLTFTNAAAASMRKKIRETLIEQGKPELAVEVDSANIQTFDAFALTLVKKYHYILGLNRNVSLIDDSVLSLIKIRMLSEIIEEGFNNDDSDITLIYKKLVRKSDGPIYDLIFSIIDHASMSGDKKNYFNNYFEKFLNVDFINKIKDYYFSKYHSMIEESIKECSYIDTPEHGDAIKECLGVFENLKSIDEFIDVFTSGQYLPFPRSTKDAKYVNDGSGRRERIKDNFDDLISFLKKNPDFDNILSIKPLVESLLRVAKKLDAKIDEFKNRTNSYSFADIAQFATDLAKREDINKELKKQFTYIMIDEFQDTNDLQDKFIQVIQNNNVYVVGDVKQSIYRFRNANCDIFLNYYKKCSDDSGYGKKVDLSANYRSREEVVEDNNKIFEKLFTLEDTDIDYNAGHSMTAKNPKLLANKVEGQNYHHEIMSYELPAGSKNYEYEARLIVSDIIRRINSGEQVYDGEEKKLRKLQFKDFAILTSAKTDYPVYQRVFTEFGVPLNAIYDKKISDNAITRIVRNLLSLIALEYNKDYINQDYKHKFLSLERSFLFECEGQDIINIGSHDKYSDYPLKKILEELASSVDELTLSSIVRSAYRKVDIYEKLIKIGNVRESFELLDYFYEVAKTLEVMNYDIFDYVKFLEDIESFEIESTISPSNNYENSVQLMTIHNSKGLQYKYVYFPQLYKKLTKGEEHSFYVSDKCGICVPDYSIHPDGKSILKDYHSVYNKDQDLLERIRLFYVALTRPEEKAIFVVNKKEFEKDRPTKVLGCKTFNDLLFMPRVEMGVYEGEITSDRVEQKEFDGEIKKYNLRKPLELDYERYEYKRASKESNDEMDSKLLELGNKFHHYLELVNFGNVDLSFVKDEKDRKILEKFVKLDIFKDAGKAKIIHEYQFYDDVNDVHGYIDLLMVYDDHIDIVDYKLSHVDDEAYEKQVTIYADYIKRVSNNKETHTYIASILRGDIKKVS